MRRFPIAAAAIGVLVALGVTLAQQDKGAKPRPGKEQEILKQFEGDWEVRAKHTDPQGKTEESQGTESAQMGLGGFWLIIDHKGTYKGDAYQGHGLMGYDPQKAKYVGVWTDSMSPSLMTFDGQADSSGKTLTMYAECVDPSTGGKVTERMVFQFSDRDHRTLRFYKPDDQGKEKMCAEMTYTRKSAEIK